MSDAILEIKDDGMAVGPVHIPAPERMVGHEGNIVQRLEDVIPLSWPTLCGQTGYVYDREGILRFDPSLGECFECRVLALKNECRPAKTSTGSAVPRKRKPRPDFFVEGPRKYATEEERKAARAATYRRTYERRRASCQDCGVKISPKRTRCRSCFGLSRRTSGPCGTITRYAAGCRCDLCRAAIAEYRRNHRVPQEPRFSRVKPKREAA